MDYFCVKAVLHSKCKVMPELEELERNGRQKGYHSVEEPIKDCTFYMALNCKNET